MKRRLTAIMLALILVISCAPMGRSGFAASSKTQNVRVTAASKKKPKKIKIEGSKSVKVGERITLTAKVSPDSADQSVKWKSGDKEIATVSSKGVVKGVKAGKVTITATSKKDSKVKATWKVEVKETEKVKKIKITGAKDLDLNGTKKTTLKVKVSPSGASDKVKWKSSDKSIAKVSSKGVVTAVSVGEAKITATATDGSKKKASVTIKVVNSADPEEDPVSDAKIGLAFPTKDLYRWKSDGDGLASKLRSSGRNVTLKYAQNDVATQIAQIESMIEDECKIIVIAAIDSASLSEVVTKANNKGITVIAYDRFLGGASWYVTFSSTEVGRLQGRYIANKLNLSTADGPFYLEITAGDPGDSSGLNFYNGAYNVLKSYIASGKLVVKSGQVKFAAVTTSGWRTDVAKSRANDIISSFYADGSNIDAWLCSNDSTALGVIQALEGSYKGKWPIITGQDCDIENVKKIIAGKQSMSVYKDTSTEYERTWKMIGQILNGTTVETTGNISGVPVYEVSPVVVDKSNYHKILIESGIYNESDF